MGTIQQATCMLGHPKQVGASRPGIGPHTFEAAHTVMQRVGQQMRAGIAPGQPLAIQPYPAVAVIERGHASHSSRQ